MFNPLQLKRDLEKMIEHYNNVIMSLEPQSMAEKPLKEMYFDIQKIIEFAEKFGIKTNIKLILWQD